MRHRRYACRDGFCGATDCVTCYGPGAGEEEEEEANLADCLCGNREWGDSDPEYHPRCGKCGTGPYKQGRTHTTLHVARKEHNNGGIKPGDYYRRQVAFGHYPDGPFTLKVNKVKVKLDPLRALALSVGKRKAHNG